MDLAKLTPAPWFPWYADGDIWRQTISSETVQRIAKAVDENHAEFIALARNALDVMMRRGWEARRHCDKWIVWSSKDNFQIVVFACPSHHDDPFTALVVTDMAWKANCEEK